MMKLRKRLAELRRDRAALAACLRVGGPMADRRAPRGGASVLAFDDDGSLRVGPGGVVTFVEDDEPALVADVPSNPPAVVTYNEWGFCDEDGCTFCG